MRVIVLGCFGSRMGTRTGRSVEGRVRRKGVVLGWDREGD